MRLFLLAKDSHLWRLFYGRMGWRQHRQQPTPARNKVLRLYMSNKVIYRNILFLFDFWLVTVFWTNLMQRISRHPLIPHRLNLRKRDAQIFLFKWRPRRIHEFWRNIVISCFADALASFSKQAFATWNDRHFARVVYCKIAVEDNACSLIDLSCILNLFYQHILHQIFLLFSSNLPLLKSVFHFFYVLLIFHLQIIHSYNISVHVA